MLRLKSVGDSQWSTLVAKWRKPEANGVQESNKDKSTSQAYQKSATGP